MVIAIVVPAGAGPIDFAAIYRANLDYVWHSLRRMGVHERDLEDVVHEVFLVVHRRLADYDRARPMKPWLFGIAFRVASDWRRSPARRIEPAEIAVTIVGDGPTPEDNALRAEAVAVVQRALAQVDDDARAVFVLAELDGVPVTEAAATLEIPVNTAYTRLRRARQIVTEALRGE
jgi:RNA polymerase sigma-70 factor, ECF subfamily